MLKATDSSAMFRFLIIEDDENDALLLTRHLKSSGLLFDWQRIETEQNLLEALKEPWDIVFSDFTMPRFSGIRALEIIRRHNSDVPFLFVSGTISEDTAVEAMRGGAQDFVMKGNTARLLPAVERELQKVEARRQHRQAEEDRRRLTAILEATPDLVAILELNGHLRYLNESGRKLCGLTPGEDINGRNIRDLFSEPTLRQFNTHVFPAVLRDGVWTGESILHTVKGKELPISIVALAHRRADGDIDYLSILAHDISERKRFESELQHKANHDSLTNLPNRYFLTDRFATELQRASRINGCVGVLFLDLDNFKRVNDSLGHEAGDSFLQAVANRLQDSLRPNDTVARIGGDEFTILTGDLDAPESMLIILRRLHAAFERPIVVDSQEIFVTFSAGIALYPYDGSQVAELLRNADTAMYKAKALGANQYCFYASEMNVRSHELLSLEAELQHALDRQEFLLHYQPQVNLRDGRVIGVECLIRWDHPARGLIPPSDFIPMLENTGMIISVGEWVLHQACKTYRGWREAGVENIRVAVNVSAVQFNDDQFLDKVCHAFRDENVPPHGIELEITENILIQKPDYATEVLKALYANGVRLAIDDFGTGYSSLAYLKSFPLHVLKIDQTFINDLGKGDHDSAIIEASISLGQKLGFEVLAEGVETAEQLDFLKTHDCNSAQGYYFSRPLPSSELMAYFKNRGLSNTGREN